VADANAVIRALGFQLAQAIIDKTIAEVEVVELRELQAAHAGTSASEGDAEPAR